MARAFVVAYVHGIKTPIGVGERAQLIDHISSHLRKGLYFPIDQLFIIIDDNGKEEDVTIEIKTRAKKRVLDLLHASHVSQNHYNRIRDKWYKD